MAERGSETGIKALKEALQAQQHLLQKLYAELDKEREASATAASEALSMIRRLEGEKAAVEMEASQYQRMAEEKIGHAEDSLASFEEIIYLKEMEIASLEFQVQAYRCKLLSLGCSDLGPEEYRFVDRLSLHKGDLGPYGEIGVDGKVRRTSSLPPIQLEESYYEKDIAEMETFEVLKPDCCPNIVENVGVCVEKSDLVKKLGDSHHYSYWEQIEMLEEQVKEISESRGSGEERSESLDGEDFGSPSMRVHDVFEIPETKQNLQPCEYQNRLQNKLSFEDESRGGKRDLVPEEPEPSELYIRDEPAKAKKPSSCRSHKNKSSKSRKGKAPGSSMAMIEQNADEIVVESRSFQQLCHRIDRLERVRDGARQEISDAGVEELRLLKEIQNQLNSIQSEMRSLKREQRSAPENSNMDVLREAMVYFWF